MSNLRSSECAFQRGCFSVSWLGNRPELLFHKVATKFCLPRMKPFPIEFLYPIFSHSASRGVLTLGSGAKVSVYLLTTIERIMWGLCREIYHTKFYPFVRERSQDLKTSGNGCGTKGLKICPNPFFLVSLFFFTSLLPPSPLLSFLLLHFLASLSFLLVPMIFLLVGH